MNTIKILVAYHKPFYIFKNDIFEPIHVGKVLAKENIPIIGDDTGDNISFLNPLYCEITAIYWAWKNLRGYDYMGLCHYRRLFLKPRKTISLLLYFKFIIKKLIGLVNENYKEGAYSNQFRVTSEHNFINDLEDTTKYIQNIVNKEKYELLIPPKYFHANKTNYEHFTKFIPNHIERLQEIINQKDEKFSIIFNKTLNDKYLYPANIFVFNKYHFNKYSTLLFDILDEHKKDYFKQIEVEYSSYNRVSGYLGELITNAYIQKILDEGGRYKELSLAFLDFN